MIGKNIMTRPSLKDCYKYYLAAILIIIMVGAIISSAFTLAQPHYVYAAAPKLSIQFTCANAVDYKQGKVCVHTQAKAALTIRIKYCTGYYAVSKSLKGTQYADTRGNHTWTWTPQTKCKGPAIAYVNEQFAGRSFNAIDKFTVK
ncbi:MAG: hypothetical protein PVS3B3_00090 [Ktedonobacteraceae bacterium]